MIVISGDIIHTRSKSLFGWAIRRCLPAWGNHDGVIVCLDGEWFVCEAVAPRFRMTPWNEYQRLIDKGKTSAVFYRPHNLKASEREAIVAGALTMVEYAPKYDWRGVIGLWWNVITKRNHARGHEWKWWCTEAVQKFYRDASPALDVWGKDQPTPYTTEKRELQCKLEYVGELGKTRYRKTDPVYIKNLPEYRK